MSTVNDSKGAVHSIFQEQYKALETLLEKLPTVPAADRPRIIDECLAGIGRLTDVLKDASTYLPAYDQRAYSLKVKTLSDKLSAIRLSLSPKQKFSFKSRSKNASGTIGGAVDIGQSAAPTQFTSAAQKAATEQENVVVTDRSDEFIRPPGATATASASLLLSSVRRCVITIPETLRFSSAAVKNVDGSLLLLGEAVNGPIHLTGARDSILVFACRQFRMHDARNVDVYLRCASRPIIEDCEDIRFHPYGDQEDPRNLWDQVDDFKWLRAEKSPHWSASRVDGAEDMENRWKSIEGVSGGQVDVKQTLSGLLKS